MSAEKVDWDLWRQRLARGDLEIWKYLLLTKEIDPDTTTPPGKDRQENQITEFDTHFPQGSRVRILAKERFGSLFSTTYLFSFVNWAEDGWVPHPLPWQMTIDTKPRLHFRDDDGNEKVMAVTSVGTWGKSANLQISHELLPDTASASEIAASDSEIGAVPQREKSDIYNKADYIESQDAWPILASLFRNDPPDIHRTDYQWKKLVSKYRVWLNHDRRQNYFQRGGQGKEPNRICVAQVIIQVILADRNYTKIAEDSIRLQEIQRQRKDALRSLLEKVIKQKNGPSKSLGRHNRRFQMLLDL